MNLKTTMWTLSALCAGVLLSACGGGGGDTGEIAAAPTPPTAPNPPPPPPPPPPGGGSAAGLPPELQALPAAANCQALRSTSYRVIAPRFSSLAQETDIMAFDAGTLTARFSDGPDTWVPNGDCRFTIFSSQAHPGDAVVAPSGVIVARYYAGDDGAYRIALLFPEQSHTLADWQGDWRFIGVEQSTPATSAANAKYTSLAGSASIDGAGHVGNLSVCPSLADCQAVAQTFTLSADAAGGFHDDDPSGSARWFLYRAASGTIAVVLDGDSSFDIVTPATARSLPAVGDENHNWNLFANTSLLSSNATSLSDFTVVSVDAAAGSWSRQASGDGHVETLLLNQPTTGYTQRPAASATASDGSTVTVQAFVAMPLSGMGMSALWLPNLGDPSLPGAFMLSVNRP